MNPVASTHEGTWLAPGFSALVPDSTDVFRRLLTAMAQPGIVTGITPNLTPPPPLEAAAAAICLTLLDLETPVWLDRGADCEAVRSWLRFHCGCPLADSPGAAAFALVVEPDRMPALAEFHLGSETYPDESATVILQVSSLEGGEAVALSGPGIRDQRDFRANGTAEGFWQQRREIEALFPLGIDLVFASGESLAAVPRSTRVEER